MPTAWLWAIKVGKHTFLNKHFLVFIITDVKCTYYFWPISWCLLPMQVTNITQRSRTSKHKIFIVWPKTIIISPADYLLILVLFSLVVSNCLESNFTSANQCIHYTQDDRYRKNIYVMFLLCPFVFSIIFTS